MAEQVPQDAAPARKSRRRLYKPEVAERLGWINTNNVNVAIKRTRDGRTPVPFPEPDGVTPIPPNSRVNRTTEDPWWYAYTIDEYDALRRRMTTMTDEMRERIHRLRTIDHYTMEEIAVRLGISKGTVFRALHAAPTTTKEK